MALQTITSANFNTDNTYIKFYQVVYEVSTDVSANTSLVQVDLFVKRTNAGYSTYGTGTAYNVINGVVYSKAITSGQAITDTPIRVLSNTVTVAHSADGTYSLPLAAQINHSSFTGAQVAWSMALTNIARASSVASLSDFTIGNVVPCTLGIQSTGYTHDLTLYIGGVLVASRPGMQAGLTNVPFTLTTGENNILYQNMVSSTTATFTVYCKTMSGTTQIGSTSSRSATVSVGAAIIPTVGSITAGTVNPITGTYIKNITPITFTMNTIAGASYSTIQSYNINFNGVDYSTNPATTAAINASGNLTATGTVTDSRGRVSTADTLVVNLLDYTTPSITAFTVQRCDSAGVLNVMGTYAKVYTKGTVKSLINATEKNVLTYAIWYKLRTSGTWLVSKAATALPAGTVALDLTQTLGAGAYAATNAYDFKLDITDKFNTVTSTVVVSTGQVTMSWGVSGVGLGKIYEVANGVLDVYGDTKLDGDLNLTGLLTLAGVAPTSSPVANSLVKRDASGYIMNNYFNSSAPATATAAVNYFYDSGDGYIRKKSLANTKAELLADFASGTGWKKDPDGVITQWGSFTTSGGNGTPTVVTYPIAFTLATSVRIATSMVTSAPTTAFTLGHGASSISGASFYCPAGTAQGWQWIAVGT